MDKKTLFGFIALGITPIQYGPYILDILKQKTHPHAFSWFVWGLPCGIVFLAQWAAGGGAGAWATGATAMACTVIFMLSLFYGERHITRLDCLALSIALAAIGLWGVTNNPLGAVILITSADLLGFIPTLRKSIAKPHEETISMYGCGTIKWLFALAALGQFYLTTWLYPLAMLVSMGFFTLFLLVRRKALSP